MKKDYNRRQYFMKQQLLGVGIMLLGLFLSIGLLDGDITVMLFTTPIGLYVTLTRKMLLTNDYYYAVKHSEKFKNRRP